MGIFALNCGICGKSFFSDTEYEHCANCSTIICSDCLNEMQLKYGTSESIAKTKKGKKFISDYGENSTIRCSSCDPKIIRGNDILDFLLQKVGKTKEEVVFLIEKDRKNKNKKRKPKSVSKKQQDLIF